MAKVKTTTGRARLARAHARKALNTVQAMKERTLNPDTCNEMVEAIRQMFRATHNNLMLACLDIRIADPHVIEYELRNLVKKAQLVMVGKVNATAVGDDDDPPSP